MATYEARRDPKLESYLTALEHVLRPFPVSDRVEIVTEIKSHVLSAMERDPEGKLELVLAALGAPETVANRYLLERGLNPTQSSIKPPIRPFVKWIVIGILGMVFAAVLVVVFLITRFTPLLKIDGEKDQISLLGGAVQFSGQISGGAGDITIVGTTPKHATKHGDRRSKAAFSGSSEVTRDASVAVLFASGQIAIGTAADGKLSWSCKARGGDSDGFRARNEQGVLTLDWSDRSGLECNVAVPRDTSVIVEGERGELRINEAAFSVRAKLESGQVLIAPGKREAYKYQLAVGQGEVERFESSSSGSGSGSESSSPKKAHTIEVSVGRGRIGKATR